MREQFKQSKQFKHCLQIAAMAGSEYVIHSAIFPTLAFKQIFSSEMVSSSGHRLDSLQESGESLVSFN